MMRQGKRGVDARMVGVARPDPIGNNGAVARFNQRVDEVAVEKSPRGISVQEDHGPRVTAPLVNVGHVAAVDAQRFLLPWEELSKPCGLLIHVDGTGIFVLSPRFQRPVAIGPFADAPARSKYSAAARNAPAARSNVSKVASPRSRASAAASAATAARRSGTTCCDSTAIANGLCARCAKRASRSSKGMVSLASFGRLGA